MTQEEKQLLIKDLCARLPYGVIVDNPSPAGGAWDEVINIDTTSKTVTLLYDGRVFSIGDVKPYLRPMSSMIEEEENEWRGLNIDPLLDAAGEPHTRVEDSMLRAKAQRDQIDWLNEHQFDYRGLIPMGLALEAPEDMY